MEKREGRHGYLHIVRIRTKRLNGTNTNGRRTPIVVPDECFEDDLVRDFGNFKGFATKLHSFKGHFQSHKEFREFYPYQSGPWKITFDTEPGVTDSGREATFITNIALLD